MKPQAALIQGGLAAVGLLSAWASWQKEPDRPPGEVVVLDATKKEIAKLRYEDDKKWAELEPDKGGLDEGVWLRIAARPEMKAPERTLRGNDTAVKLFEKFAPLHATRALGVVGEDKLKDYGLAAAAATDGGAAVPQPKKKVLVTARGSVAGFVIGSSPFGVSDPYVKDERDGRVFVLGGGVLSDLENAASRLVDRTMHAFSSSEYDGLVISAGAKKRQLTQLGPESPGTAKLASAASPQKPDETAKNWHDKVWRAAPVDVLGKDEQPTNGAPTQALRIDYTWHGKAKGFVEFGRVASPQPAGTSAPPLPAEIYARSEHTAGWVRLSMAAEDFLKEAEKIAGTE